MVCKWDLGRYLGCSFWSVGSFFCLLQLRLLFGRGSCVSVDLFSDINYFSLDGFRGVCNKSEGKRLALDMVYMAVVSKTDVSDCGGGFSIFLWCIVLLVTVGEKRGMDVTKLGWLRQLVWSNLNRFWLVRGLFIVLCCDVLVMVGMRGGIVH